LVALGINDPSSGSDKGKKAESHRKKGGGRKLLIAQVKRPKKKG